MALPTELAKLAEGLSADDQALLDGILGRNQDLSTKLVGQTNLYDAFVAGDDAAVTRLTDAGGNNQPGSALADLNKLTETISQRLENQFGGKFTEFGTKVDALKQQIEGVDVGGTAKTAAEDYFKSQRDPFVNEVVGKALKQADELYSMRSKHREEFGKEMDSAAFEKFVVDNPGKFKTLTEAHDLFVSDARTQKKIDDGVTAALAARATSAVPGQELPTSGPLGMMLKKNEEVMAKENGVPARGAAIDSAVKMFDSLQAGRQN